MINRVGLVVRRNYPAIDAPVFFFLRAIFHWGDDASRCVDEA
ncbi:MAG: hypothetical protein XXXJIFNMEKO3_02805 [Candidatus Erwinia impunctatus]|nr:hypothetical protein XXXJIFNMEKO_02805 [Culicoides impunctatus]